MFLSAISRVSPYASWWVLMSMVRFYLEGNIKEQNIQWRIQGMGPRGPGSPLPPPYLRGCMAPPPPPSLGCWPPPPPPPPYLRVWIRRWYFHFSRLPGSWSKRRIFFTFSESVKSGRNEPCHLNFLRYFRHSTTCSWVEKIQFKHLEIKLNLIFAFFLTQVKDESSLLIFPLRYLLLLIVLH